MNTHSLGTRRVKRLTSVIASVGLVVGLAACASSAEPQERPDQSSPSTPALDTLEIRLNWTYEAADHPWFFAGMQQGIYEKHGIDLVPLEGTGSASTLQLVASGSDPVGLVDAGTMMGGIGKQMPVQSVCVLAQRNPMSAIFPASSGFTSLDDLRGKNIAVTPGDSLSQIFPAVLASNGMSEGDVNMVGLSDPAAKQNSVLTGASDAFLGYFTLQLPAVEMASGEEMDYLSFSELGVDTLSMAIVINTNWAEENKDLLGRFLAATQEAAEYIVANPEAAADDFVKGVPGFDRELALTQINGAISLLHTDRTKGQPICVTDEADWQDTEDILSEYTGLAPASSLSTYFTNEFVK